MVIENQVLSVDQCRKLISLGLNMENTSMCWVIEENGEHQLTLDRSICDKDLLPTFTLQEILARLPKVIIKDKVEYALMLNTYHSYIAFNNYVWEGGKAFRFKDCSILDAAYKLLVWCLENKYI